MHPSSSDRRTLRELLAAEIQKDPSIVGARVPEGRGSRTVDLHTPIAPPADASSLKPIRASDPEGLHTRPRT
jgi:hypothetical protein